MTNSEHAKYAPSSSERWLKCPGSIGLSEKIENEDSDESTEGSYLHSKAEICARYGLDPFSLVGEEAPLASKTHVFSYENALWLDIGLSWLEDLKDDSEIRYEEKINTFLDQFGSPDIVIYRYSTKHLVVFDWKFGYYGVRAKDNTQLGLYAVGHLNRLKQEGLDVEKVTLAICQPKIDHNVEEETYEDLDFFSELEGKAEKVYGSEEIKAGAEQCMFCPAKFICPDYRDHVMELIDFMVENFGKYKNLSNEDLEKTLVNKKLITDFLKNAEEEALHRLESGVSFEEIDLVVGKKPAAEWTKDEGEIVSYFTEHTTLRENELYNSTLKTPAQVLDLLGSKNPDKVRLVAENSKRGNPPKKVIPRFGKGTRVAPVSDMFNDF
jgi:hypothetical protein